MDCKECHTIQLKEYSEDIFRYAYFSDYYGGVNAKFKFPFSFFFHRGKKQTAKYISSYLSNMESTILDIGCGRAGLLKELHGLGFSNVYGNDIEKPKSLPSYIRFFKGSIADQPLKSNFFDFVSMFHVFEHLPNPNSILDSITHMIKPGGKFYIVYPDVESRQYKLYKDHWFHLDPPRHLHLIPSSRLVIALEKRGFKLVDKVVNFPSYHIIGYTQSILNQRLNKRDLFYEMLKRGHSVKTFRDALLVMYSLLFTAVTFFYYAIRDKRDVKNNAPATVGFVFEKQ